MADNNGFVTVYVKNGPTKGAKQRIPKHWLGVPSIAKQFTKTPRQKKADEQQGTRPIEPVATTPDERANAAVAPETPAAGENKE